MKFFQSLVGKLWLTVILLVAFVLLLLGMFLLYYIEETFPNPESIKNLFIFVALLGFFLTVALAFFFFILITKPLKRLQHAASLISRGNYKARVKIYSNDEMGDLARTFNQMSIDLQSTIQRLHEEKEHLSGVLKSMTDAVISFDAYGRVILSNPRGEKILKQWQHLSNLDFEIHTDTKGVPAPLFPYFQCVLNHAGDIATKIYVERKVFSVVFTPLYAQKIIRGVVVVLRDVSEEEQVEKMRNIFLANVSHEIRTPLSMIQGYSEALLDDMVSSVEEAKELIQIINDESVRMGRLVKDLLDLSTMEANQMDMKRMPIDLAEVLDRVSRKFSVLAKEQSLEFVYESVSEELCMQAGDADRLEQVFTNLLDNAFRHTPTGKKIEMKVCLKLDTEEIEVSIEDQGSGVSPEDIPYIFERFYKTDKARTRSAYSGEGTGLGLAIVKNIVGAHKGNIQVHSTLGEGTAFIIGLPIKGD